MSPVPPLFARSAAALAFVGCATTSQADTSGAQIPAPPPEQPAAKQLPNNDGVEVFVIDASIPGSLAALQQGAEDVPCYFMADVVVAGTRTVELRHAKGTLRGSLHCGEDESPFAAQLAGRVPAVFHLLRDGDPFGGAGSSEFVGVDLIFAEPGRLNNNSGVLGSDTASWFAAPIDNPHLLVLYPPSHAGVAPGTFAAAALLRTGHNPALGQVDAPLTASMRQQMSKIAACIGSARGGATLAIEVGPQPSSGTVDVLATTLSKDATKCVRAVVQAFPVPQQTTRNVVFVPVWAE